MEPELNLIAIKVKKAAEVAARLKEAGWYVGFDEESEIIRIVVMPHVSNEMINKFVEDLRKVME